MKKVAFMVVFIVLTISISVGAEGGGGVEFIGNAGSNGTPAIARLLTGDPWLDLPTGAIAGIGGFGYGITWDALKIGGFGFGFLSGDISKILPAFAVEIVGMAGGFGGVILGTQSSAGPFVFAINTRLGAGGIAVRQKRYPPRDPTSPYGIGTAALYGNIDVEAGLTLNGIMLISAYAGVSGIVALTFMEPPVIPLFIPDFGIRITWGSF